MIPATPAPELAIKPNRNVWFLTAAQACFLATSMTLVSFIGLSGKALSPDPAYATLGASLLVLATALSTAPFSVLMGKTSRRFGFRLGAFFGILGGTSCALSLVFHSFWLLCIGGLLAGLFQASAQYYRFAAAESVAPTKAPRAMSLVLVGGLVAALFTPTLTGWLNIKFGEETYIGAFVFVACMAAIALIPLSFVKPASLPTVHQTAEEPPKPARPLLTIVRTPMFIVAALNAGLGFAMMTFVMTATPLALHGLDYASHTSARVIQAHVIAMFLPSLFTGNLIIRFGEVPIMLAGHTAFALAFFTALSGVGIGYFSLSLIALGLGWNFCFLSGSSLLTKVHSESEKGKVQGLNEFIVFGLSAVGSFAAGVILYRFGWAVVNQAAFAMLAVAAGATSLWGLAQLRARTVL